MRFDLQELRNPTGTVEVRPVIRITFKEADDIPFVCLFDTGSNRTLFSREIADDLGIPLRGAEGTTKVGGIERRYWEEEVSISICNWELDAVVAFADPWPRDHFPVVGLPALQRFTIRLAIYHAWLEIAEAEIA